MEQLIWYTIPGGIALAAFILTHLAQISTSQVVAAVAASPIVGFVLHQAARTIFEFFYGYDSERRRVVALLMERINDGEEDRTCLRRKAFLTWELTFYSNDVPEAYRQHDRGSWHYIMSFWSVCIAAAIGIVVILSSPSSRVEMYGWILVYVCIGVLFVVKALLTIRSISEQEVALVRKYKDAFLATAGQLSNMEESESNEQRMQEKKQ